MAKERVNKEKVIKCAVEMTDQDGIQTVSLKEISKRLQISSPALYNHVESLEEIKNEISYYAMAQLKEALVKSVIGKSGMDAFKSLGKSYIRFAWEHPGLYETIQWMDIRADDKSDSLFAGVIDLIYEIGTDLGADELESSHLIRTMRSITHGFASLNSHHAFSHESSVESSLDYAVDIFFLGIEARRQQGWK